jgi:AcrR family transcriptional regulator
VVAARAVAASEGPEQLTLRGVGERMGLSAPTLLWHVGSRERLMVDIVDLVIADITLPDREAGLDPRDWVRLAATAIRHGLLRQPRLLPLVRDLMDQTPAALDLEIRLVEGLEVAGFDGAALLRAYACFTAYVYGFTFAEHAQLRTESTSFPELAEERRRRLNGHRERATPPTTGRLLHGQQERPSPEQEYDEDFVAGLEALLNGLATTPPGGSRPHARTRPASAMSKEI